MIGLSAKPIPLVPEPKLRTLIASDDARMGEEIRSVLVRSQPDCVAHPVVPIECMADRAAQVNPCMVLVALPDERESAYRAMRQLSRALPTHLLAVGPADDPRVILRTLHQGGAHEYLDERRLEEEIAGAVLRFRSRRSPDQDQETGRVVSFLAPSGGSGASTLAANVAVVLASAGPSCGLMDLRLRAGDLSALLDMQPQYGIADLCENLDRIDRGLFDRFFERHPSGVRILSAPHDHARASLVTARGIRQAVAMARSEFPYVVIDLDNAFDEAQLEALWQSDLIVLVLRLDYTSLRNVRRAMDHLQQTGVDADRVALVANRVGERNQLSVTEAQQALGCRLYDQIPDDAPRINAAVNAGMPVVLHRPRGRSSRRISALANQLTQRLAPPGRGASG